MNKKFINEVWVVEATYLRLFTAAELSEFFVERLDDRYTYHTPRSVVNTTFLIVAESSNDAVMYAEHPNTYKDNILEVAAFDLRTDKEIKFSYGFDLKSIDNVWKKSVYDNEVNFNFQIYTEIKKAETSIGNVFSLLRDKMLTPEVLEEFLRQFKKNWVKSLLGVNIEYYQTHPENIDEVMETVFDEIKLEVKNVGNGKQ